MIPLAAAATTTLDAAGAGSVTVGPVPVGERWFLTRITLGCTDPDTGDLARPIPRVEVRTSLARIVDSSRIGDDNSAELNRHVIHPGESVTCEWTDGPAGGLARFQVVGDRELRR